MEFPRFSLRHLAVFFLPIFTFSSALQSVQANAQQKGNDPEIEAAIDDFKRRCSAEIAQVQQRYGQNRTDLLEVIVDEYHSNYGRIRRLGKSVVSDLTDGLNEPDLGLTKCSAAVALDHVTNGVPGFAPRPALPPIMSPAIAASNKFGLREQDIAPCRLLLRYRLAEFRENTDYSNLEFALYEYPFNIGRGAEFSVADISARATEDKEHLAELESGNFTALEMRMGPRWTASARSNPNLVKSAIVHQRRLMCMGQVKIKLETGQYSKRLPSIDELTGTPLMLPENRPAGTIVDR